MTDPISLRASPAILRDMDVGSREMFAAMERVGVALPVRHDAPPAGPVAQAGEGATAPGINHWAAPVMAYRVGQQLPLAASIGRGCQRQVGLSGIRHHIAQWPPEGKRAGRSG
ncbi:hypothetical protein [Sphingomonas parapaucimobilis]|uniref:hypothetical protein n=1 Tax=Sphingomonas parapaucimobilis TaxID=28213 RepID=UPI003918AA68